MLTQKHITLNLFWSWIWDLTLVNAKVERAWVVILLTALPSPYNRYPLICNETENVVFPQLSKENSQLISAAFYYRCLNNKEAIESISPYERVGNCNGTFMGCVSVTQ